MIMSESDSSDQEEMEVTVETQRQENITNSENVPAFVWNKESVHKLISQVLSQVPATDMTPWNHIEVDWGQVDCGTSARKCKEKWNSLVKNVRHYRTFSEVAMDILTQLRDPQIGKLNKQVEVKEKVLKSPAKGKSTSKRPKVNPDYPPKPKSSGYSIFSVEKMKELKGNHFAQDTMREIGHRWKMMSSSNKQKYMDKCLKEKEEYLQKLEEYAEEHPDDEVFKEILEEERNRKSKRRNKKKTGGSLSIAGQIPVHKYFTNMKPVVESEDSVLDSTIDTMQSSPVKSPKKRPVEDQESPSPKKRKSPKKKRTKTQWTGELMFIQSKIEAYQLDHPDLEMDELNSKLSSKYKKMNDHKKAKYDKKASKRNNEES